MREGAKMTQLATSRIHSWDHHQPVKALLGWLAPSLLSAGVLLTSLKRV